MLMLIQSCTQKSMLFSKVLLSSAKNSFCNNRLVSAASKLQRASYLTSEYRTYRRSSIVSGDASRSFPSGDANLHPDPRSYEVVVAATHDMGIGKDGKLPWRLPSDLNFFKKLTLTTSNPGKKNAVVMGRKTWESIPLRYRPLPGRLNVVLTRSGSSDITAAENVVVCGSIPSALELLAEAPYSFSIERVFIIGGGQILRETINAPGCDAIHITEIETSIKCDTFIPAVDSSLFQLWYSSLPLVENNIRYSFVTYVRVKNSENRTHFERTAAKSNGNLNSTSFENFSSLPKFIFEKHNGYIYLRLVEEIISSGTLKDDQTGSGTLSKFGCQMHFNLRRSFPLFATKGLFWGGVVEELLWFISGSTNAKVLQEKDVHIWDGNASRDYLDRYTDMHADYTGQGFDQLDDGIDKIKKRPDDRRIILSAWNPSDLKLMALPPFHIFAQFFVANGELSCQIYQCSADMGLEVPFNLASYALLTCMIAHVCGLVPGDFIHVIGDAYIYKTLIGPLQKQLQKLPRPFPILRINPHKMEIGSFRASDFELIGHLMRELT